MRFERGLLIYPGGGTADGRAGDHILLAPPYNVTDEELEMIVGLLGETVDAVAALMSRDPRYDILFEPVQIGPVTARNRFYQVPHCTGIGWTQPEALARLRGIKAEGGWAVVATEETEIHPTADCEPFHEGRLWDDRDIPAMALMADAVHEHGALAAIEIMHHGGSVANWGTRLAPMAPSHRPIIYNFPVQARAMDKQDIRNLRQWHRDAAIRSKKAGFDIVYVYATHDLSIAHQFLQRRKNDRIDEYGGSLENRARLLRELIEDTKDAVGDKCAVAVRFCADELIGEEGLTHDGEARDVDRDARRASRPLGRQYLERGRMTARLPASRRRASRRNIRAS